MNVPSFVARNVHTVVRPRWLDIVPFTMLIWVDDDGEIPVTANPLAEPSWGSVGASLAESACIVT